MFIINELELYTNVYSTLVSKYLPYWALTPLRRLVRKLGNKRLPIYFRSHPISLNSDKSVLEDLIVSFTSFPARIDYVWMVIQSIKRQTYLPSKIILWLSKDQFPNEVIPINLQQECDELFEVRFVESDIKSHKKYQYVSKEFPHKFIFLIDDDIIYEPDLLERIWKAHLANPNAVISNYGRLIKFNASGIVLPYSEWEENFEESNDKALFFGSGGGTLINPSMLYKDLIDTSLALKLTPKADDIWLNAMMRLAKVPCFMIKHGLYFRVDIPNNLKLASSNVGDNMNDQQINNVVEYYSKTIGRNPFDSEN